LKNVSPKWGFDDATYDRTAAPFNNPDRVAIVIHNYRWRLSLAKGEYAKKFSGKYSHRILNGIDHNMPQEDP
jgi:hypothetical protein